MKKLFDLCKTYKSYIFDECDSIYEMIVKLYEFIEQNIIPEFEGILSNLRRKEDSSNITTSRKLSPDGDFTGTLCNGAKTACEVVADIDYSKSAIDEVARILKDKESLEYIVDGGIYPFTGEVNYDIDGGVM